MLRKSISVAKKLEIVQKGVKQGIRRVRPKFTGTTNALHYRRAQVQQLIGKLHTNRRL